MKRVESPSKDRDSSRTPKYRKGADRISVDSNVNEKVSDISDDITHDDSSIVQIETIRFALLTDEEFLQKYRMSRKSFAKVLERIQHHSVFQKRRTHGRKHPPVFLQLLAFLEYIGTEGGSVASDTKQRNTVSLGHDDTFEKDRKRVMGAILSLRDQYLQWPDGEEREKIASEIHQLYGFPDCVGIADGTHFPLAHKPRSSDAFAYSTRKHRYSFNTMVVCDHNKKIRSYLCGYPGSATDYRVFQAMELSQDAASHFSPNQYLVGDSAFENHWFMVPAFKKFPRKQVPEDKQKFNSKLSKLRPVSDHCIGSLKGRFPWLRRIPLRITEDVGSIVTILRVVDATVVLHNMLIEFGEEEQEDWINFDEFSDIDEADKAPFVDFEIDDELIKGRPKWKPKRTRRWELLQYFKGIFFRNE
ncbi:DDE superfamily endonuclease [Nitzschia inconspicua]|uniref:DDE superfamily endonuclease n=1 Tax=Nitzschia inconspicua TaxID=303405 RepID=A0A9K3KHN2_9STRA|nr:DDE superfamily endonuclease [Nitzschia inconspicua]